MTLRRLVAVSALVAAATAAITGCTQRTVTSRNYTATNPNARRAAEAPRTVKKSPIEGRYAINGRSSDRVVITRIQGDQYRVESPGFWEGVGFFDGKVYLGVFRYPKDSKHGSLGNAVGTHRAALQSDGSFKVHGSFSGEGFGEFDVVWKKL